MWLCCCGADAVLHVRVCSCTRTHALNFKWAGASASPSSGLTGRNHCVCCHGMQVPSAQAAKFFKPQGEEKGWQARRPHPQILRIRAGDTFSITLTLEDLVLALNAEVSRDVSSWSANSFDSNATLLTLISSTISTPFVRVTIVPHPANSRERPREDNVHQTVWCSGGSSKTPL